MKSNLSKGIVVGIISLLSIPIYSQTYTLEQCHEEAAALSPINRQKAYNESIYELQRLNAGKSNLPQMVLSAQATYQSDVFELPFSPPGVENPEIPKDQYRAALTVQQKIFDGGTVKAGRQVVEANYTASQQLVEVDLYQIKDQINQVYFGILLLQEQGKILKANHESLSLKLKELESLVENGVVIKSNVLSLKKQLLLLEQQQTEVESNQNALIAILSKWLSKDVETNSTFVIPNLDKVSSDLSINTPYLGTFDAQSKVIEANKSFQSVRNSPKVFAFATGGVGSPNPYNFFETEFSEYYMLGLKLEWNIYDYGRKKNDLKVLEYQTEIINSKRDNYLRLTEISMINHIEDMDKYQRLIDQDSDILMLQKQVVSEAASQLDNGVITSTQYLTEVNNQLQIELNAKIHELKLVQSQIEYLTKSGNL